jgi:hypothetical protein
MEVKKTYLLLRTGVKTGRRRSMRDSMKIRNLLDYWMSHNENHAESYMRWAAWASDEGNEELSRILVRLALESKRLNRLFGAAKKASS